MIEPKKVQDVRMVRGEARHGVPGPVIEDGSGRAAGRIVPANAWRWYLVCGAMAGALYFALPHSLLSKIVLYNGIGLSAVIALLVGIRRSRPAHVAGWWLITAGAMSFLSADICYYVLEAVSETTPFPSLADLFYLGMYPLVISGLALLLRRSMPRRDWAGLLDAGVIAVATFAVLGVLVMDTYVTDDSLGFAGKWISVAYPVMDVALIAVAARLAVAVHLRHSAFGLLAGGLCSLLVADTIYGVLNSAGLFQTGGVADAFWMGFYLLLGAAGLRLDSAALEPRQWSPGHISKSRLGVLCLVVLAVPTIDLIWGQEVDRVLTTISSAVMFLLVLGRTMGLMRVVQENEARARRDASHDSLTGLPNRVLFNERVERFVGRGGDGVVSVLFIDLDDFKIVNDSLGHQVGDELLRTVADRLTECVRAEDVVARLSGDEFAVLLESAVDRQDAVAVAQRVQDALSEPFHLAGREVMVSGSVGITVERRDQVQRPETLLRAADAAMYRAKHQGKGRVEFFDSSMHFDAEDHLELKTDLQAALERNQLEVYYQPIVRLADDRVVGVEALVRWHHPVRGFMTPDRFIPLAEQTGLIVPIGRWVLREACFQAVRWRRRYPATAPEEMCVNLSARQLNDPNLFGDVADALAESGLPASSLTLELTESLLIEDNVRGTRVLERLKAMNVRIAIDDFGTGYSSLSYLRRFSVDAIKIDRSFVEELTGTDVSNSLVRAIVDLARTINVDVVAEGIETAAQHATLREMQCASGQGYYFARPLPAAEVVACFGGGLQAAQRPSRKVGTLEVQVLAGLAGLRLVAEAIDAFHVETGAPVYARLPWLTARAEEYPEWEPLTFVVRDRGGQDVHGLALLAARTVRGHCEIVTLGDGVIGGAQLLARGQREARLLARGLTGHLNALTGHWELRLSQLPADDPIARVLAKKLPGAVLSDGVPVPHVVFGAGRAIDGYLSANMQRQLRRARNRIVAGGHHAEIDVACGGREIGLLLPSLERIHVTRDRSTRGASDLDEPAALRFWRRVVLDHARLGCVEVTTLSLDGELAAYVIALIDGASYRVFDGHFSEAFARFSPGRLVEAAVLERAMGCAELTELDWLAGVAVEKILAANTHRPRLTLAANSEGSVAESDGAESNGAESNGAVLQRPANSNVMSEVAVGGAVSDGDRPMTRSVNVA
ncbi:MAG: GNAT family N-acetyltransferase [Acidimicrobiales bacterium]